MESQSKTLTGPSAMDHLVLFSSSIISPFLLRHSCSPVALLLHLLRRLLLLFLRLLVFLLHSHPRWAPHQPPSTSFSFSSSPGPTAAERALSHVLSVVSRVPVASRKYELVRSLADRLLDDNLSFSSAINVGALSSAFCQTIRRLEIAVTPQAEGGPVEMVMSAVRNGVRRLGDVAGGEVSAGDGKGAAKVEAEKMVAEVVWLAEKMAECGAVEEAVRRWGEAEGLARVALAAEPRIQVALVRVSGYFLNPRFQYSSNATVDNEVLSGFKHVVERMEPDVMKQLDIHREVELYRMKLGVFYSEKARIAATKYTPAFLYKHANAKQFGRKGEGEEEEGEEDKESLISRYRMAMLTSWLPLLCRASNGTDAPVLSSGERAEMVNVLEEMIEKLCWEQQEEVIALWLHHFTSCPDSDWPNLEACYTRWYSKSRDLLLKRLN